MGNPVGHFEIGGPDDQPLVAYYGELFGWNLQAMEGGPGLRQRGCRT